MASGGDDNRQDLDRQLDLGPLRVQVAGNETTARTINEAIEEGRVTASGVVGFVCECDSLGCVSVLELSLDEYEDVRRDPRQYLVAQGHDGPSDAVVVSVGDRLHDHRQAR